MMFGGLHSLTDSLREVFKVNEPGNEPTTSFFKQTEMLSNAQSDIKKIYKQIINC